MKVKNICLGSIMLLLLPNIIFALGYLRTPYAFIICVVFLFLFIRMFKSQKKNEQKILISKSSLLFLVVLCMLFVWISGGGGFFSQFYDYEIRNPMFRDIIFEEWPIVYSETNNALVYYYLFWFLPALLGKFMIQIGMTTELVWFISNVLLYIQMVFYLFLIFMLVLAYTNKGEVVTTRTIAQLAACFAAFGGISIIGFEITELLGINRQTETVLGSILIEHYISNIGVLNNWWVMLGNVFNQMLPGLLCLMVFLVCDRIEIAGYLLGLILLMAPYPAMGICVIMGASYIKKCFLNKRVNIRAIFTEYNLWAIIWACICIMFYFGVPGASIKINKFWTGYANIGLIILAIFAYHFFMWLCYFLCVYKQAENKFLLIFSGICLTLFIFGNFDFNARATMGPYFILFIEVFRHVYEKKKNYSGVIILLAWGIITPILSYNDLAIDTKERGSLRGDRDAFYTLSNADETDIYYIGQYIKSNPEQDLFFSKLCKKWDVIQEYPIIKYGYMEDETRYISQATFFSKEAEQKFCSMITGESLTAFETNYLEDNMDHTINLNNLGHFEPPFRPS